MSSIEVLVIRSNHLAWNSVLEALQALPNASVVAETAQIADAIQLCERHAPDWIVSAASIEEESTLPVLNEVRRRYGASVRFIVIGWALDDRDRLRGFLTLDPVGCFVWPELTSFALPAYLESIRTGAAVMGPAALYMRGSIAAVGLDSDGGQPAITGRQREVLRMLVGGLTRTEIRLQLSVSPETVHRDIRSLREVLNAQTEAEMVFKATRIGLTH